MAKDMGKLRGLSPEETTLLSDEDRDRSFASDHRRRQYQCGRALLRLLLQHVTGNDADSHCIEIEEGGKPFCAGGPAVSIAHTDTTVVALATHAGLAGIDVERVEEERDVSQIAQRFFSDEERGWISGGSVARFYMLWVLKEAFVKAHGRSIFGGLEKLRCTVEPPHIAARAEEGGYDSLSLYQDSDMFLGLATTQVPLGDTRFFCWPPGSLELADSSRYSFIAST